jgi:hypothetical protein
LTSDLRGKALIMVLIPMGAGGAYPRWQGPLGAGAQWFSAVS